MHDFSDLYDDIFYYYKELERLTAALKNDALSPAERSKAQSRLADVQKKIGELTEKIPENT